MLIAKCVARDSDARPFARGTDYPDIHLLGHVDIQIDKSNIHCSPNCNTCIHTTILICTYVGESGWDGELRKFGGELRLITSRYSSATTWEG